MTLDEQLQALKDAEREVAVPPHLEASVMARFDERQMGKVRGHRSQKYPWRVIGALAAGLVIGVGLTTWQLGRDGSPTLSAVPVSESVVLVVDPAGAEETVRVMRIRVARSALEQLGIDTLTFQDPDDAHADSVEVDVLVGEDGVARGVRLAM